MIGRLYRMARFVLEVVLLLERERKNSSTNDNCNYNAMNINKIFDQTLCRALPGSTYLT